MRKKYFIVDAQTNEILTSVKIGVTSQVIYDKPPKFRKAVRMSHIGIHCYLGILVLAVAAYFIRSLFQEFMICGFFLSATALISIYAGAFLKSNVKKLYSDDSKKQNYVPSVGPWLDPYGLAQEPIDDSDPTKKTYYIVDPEKNAIVDVKRLGKWGQAYVERRRKKQQT